MLRRTLQSLTQSLKLPHNLDMPMLPLRQESEHGWKHKKGVERDPDFNAGTRSLQKGAHHRRYYRCRIPFLEASNVQIEHSPYRPKELEFIVDLSKDYGPSQRDPKYRVIATTNGAQKVPKRNIAVLLNCCLESTAPASKNLKKYIIGHYGKIKKAFTNVKPKVQLGGCLCLTVKTSVRLGTTEHGIHEVVAKGKYEGHGFLLYVHVVSLKK